MIRALVNYFLPKEYKGAERYRREVQWGRLFCWLYPLVAVFTFGHLWVNAPVETCRYISSDFGDGFEVKVIVSSGDQVTDEAGREWTKERIKCDRDGWWTGAQALAGGAAWPLTASIALSQELAE